VILSSNRSVSHATWDSFLFKCVNTCNGLSKFLDLSGISRSIFGYGDNIFLRLLLVFRFRFIQPPPRKYAQIKCFICILLERVGGQLGKGKKFKEGPGYSGALRGYIQTQHKRQELSFCILPWEVSSGIPSPFGGFSKEDQTGREGEGGRE